MTDTKKLLIVEDDALLRASLEKQFGEAGYEVATAPDGEIGLEMFKNDEPDVVLLDVMMPKKTGLEMLAEIRQKLPETNASFIVLSSRNEMDKVAEAMTYNALAYLIKDDVGIDRIVATVEQKLSH